METKTRKKQSLWRMLQMATIFVVLNLSPPCNAVATNPVESNPIVSTSTIWSSYLTTRGYSLTQAEMWKPSDQNGSGVTGFRLTFSPDCCGGANITQMYGTQGSGQTLFSASIVKKITTVSFLYNYQMLRDIEFAHPDATKTQICGCNSGQCSNRKTKTVASNLIGMAVKNNFSSVNASNEELSIWNDTGESQCGQPVTSIAWKTKILDQVNYFLYGTAVTTIAYQTDLLGICFTPTLVLTYKKNGSTVSQPTWLTHDATNMKFTYSSTNAADIGLYTVTMECFYSSLPSDTYSFTITIKHDCLNTTFSAQIVTNMTITVGAAATTQLTLFPDSIAITRGNAAYCGTRSFSFSPSLAFLTITGGNTLNGVTSSASDVSGTSVTMTVSLVDYSTIPSISKVFTVTVICTISALSMSPTSYSIQMANQPFSIAFTQTQSCGVNPTLSPSTDSFMSLTSLTSTGGNVQVSGFSAFNVGTKNYTLTRTYLTQNQTVSFTVILLCSVTSLTFSTSVPSTQTIQVGITSQPNTIPFAITQSPSCNKTITFTLTQTSPAIAYAAVSLQGITSFGGNVQITGAVIADHATYSYTLSAAITEDSQSIASNFNVVIQDPCSIAVLQTLPAPILDMTVSIPNTGTQSQTIQILTDVEVANPTIVCPITAILTPSASYISLGGSSASIDVNRALLIAPTDLGSHPFTLTVNSSNFFGTVLQKTYSFNLIATCAVTSLTFSTSVPSTQTIQVGITSQPQTIPFAITQSPSCNKTITFTLAQTSPATAYAAVSLSGGTSVAGNLQVSGAVIADHATYSYTLTAAITADSQSIASNFNVVIKNPCSTAVLQTLPVPIVDMIVFIPSTGTQSQTIRILTDVEVAYPTIVCPITASLSPSATYISVGVSSATIEINRNLLVSPTDLGSHPFTLTVNSSNFSGTVLQKTYSFNVIPVCIVTSLTFSTSVPSTQTIKVGITSQPNTIPFQITQIPSCNKIITFTLAQTSPATAYAAVSLSGISSFGGNVQVFGAVIADHATYSYTLTAAITADLQSITSNFNVVIKNPCSTAVFQTLPAPITNIAMVLSYGTVQIITQTIKILTDVEVAHQTIICPISAVLNPLKPFLTLKTDFTLLTVTGSNTSELDARIYSFSLTVTSPNFTAVSVAVYNFTLDLQQCINTFSFTKTVANLSYKVNQGVFNTSQFEAVQDPLVCNFPITFSLSMSLGGVAFPTPNWITFDTLTRKIVVNQLLHNNLGLFTLTVDATIPLTVTGTTAYTKATFSFTLDMIDDCFDTVFVDLPITNMLTKVSQAPDIQSINFQNTISVGHADPTYCGPMTPTLIPASILTISGSNLTLVTTDPADLGITSVVLLTQLTNFSSITISKSFTIEVQCEVISITSILVPTDVNFMKDDPAVVMPFIFMEFPRCGLTYALSPSLTFVQMQLATKDIKVESLNYYDRGTYKMRLDVLSAQGISLSKGFTVVIVDVCTQTIFELKVLPNIEVFQQDKTRVFYQILGSFLYDTLQKKNFDCGPVEVVLTVHKDTRPPDWTSLSEDQRMITFNLNQQTQKIPKFQFDLMARLATYPDRNITTSFNFTQSTLELECSPSKNVIYNLDTSLTFSIGYINKTYTSNPVTAIFENYVLNHAGEQISQSGFIEYNPQSNDFSIRTNSWNDLGKYKFVQKISYKQNKDYYVTCTANLLVTYVVDFKGDFIKDVTINCDKPQKIQVPEFTDLFNKKAELMVKLDSASLLFNYDDKIGVISLNDDNTSLLFQHPGEYEVTYTLVDQLKNQRSYSFKIYVVCFNIQFTTTRTVVPKRPFIVVDNPPKPFIQSIDQIGKVRIAFTQKIQIITCDLYPEFKGRDMMRPQLNSTDVGNATAVRRSRSLQQQEPTKKLSIKDKEKQAIDILNRGIVKINNTDFPLVELKMKPGNESDPVVLNFTYVCIAFKETYMDFQVNFTNFTEVSVKNQKDTLEAFFYGSQYFRTEADTTFRQDTLVEISKNVPLQLNLKVGAILAVVGNSIQNGSKAVVVANFVLNMALSGLLQDMFAAIKKMQVMIHLLLVNVVVPASCQMFFNRVLNLVTYNIVDLAPQIKRWLQLDNDAAIADNFDLLGYNSHFVILIMSNFFLALLVILFMLTLILGAIPLAKKFPWVRNLRQRLMKKMMWAPILDLLNETYIGMSISVFINLYFWQDKDNIGKMFNLSLSTCFVCCIVIAYPIFCLFFLLRNYENLRNDWYREKFGSIYENFQYTRGKIKVTEPFYSAVRRLIMAVVLVFLKDYPTFQIIMITYSWCAIVIITGHIRPFKYPSDYFIDCFNELFILLLIYHLICFADFVKEFETQVYIGWSMVFVMMINIGINFTIILWGSIIKLYKSLRTKYWQWKLARILKKRAKAQKLKEQIRKDYLSLIGDIQLQANQRNSFFRNDMQDYDQEDPNQSSDQGKNQLIEQSEEENSSVGIRDDRVFMKVEKRRRSLSDVVAEMNMKDLQVQEHKRQQEQDDLEQQIVVKTKKAPKFKKQGKIKKASKFKKKKLKTKIQIQEQQSLSVIEEDQEDVASYADNIFDKYQPPLLVYQDKNLESLRDPFSIGLEGIQLARKVEHFSAVERDFKERAPAKIMNNHQAYQGFSTTIERLHTPCFGGNQHRSNRNAINHQKKQPLDDQELYFQHADIEDPFDQLSRVEKRQKSIRNQFTSLDQSQKKFDNLWKTNVTKKSLWD